MRIAIVNDLSIAIEAIRRVLTAAGHEVAWVARNGVEAAEKCAKDTPHLILMDLMMPVLSGEAAVRRIMTDSPCPILIVTAAGAGHRDKVYEALGAGALDVVKTPVLGAADSSGPDLLLAKIESIGSRIGTGHFSQKLPVLPDPRKDLFQHGRLVAIGASAGGPNALMEILGALSADFPAAIVIIQHLDAQFLPGLAEWLNQHSRIPVRLANEGDKPVAGTALMAGKADHLIFTDGNTLGYTCTPVENVYRPSVDIFFQSVVEHWRGAAAGVLLTGMGRDGAKGLKMLRDAKFDTMAQDRMSSAVYGMPKAAAALNAAAEILPLGRIAPALEKLFVPPSHRKDAAIYE